MQELNLREIQLVELKLLTDFDEYCRKHELHYSICSGTLLGAVRHKGFIPWDDDIDVQMPREDYNSFIRMASQEKTFNIVGYGINKKGKIEYAPYIRIVDPKTMIKQIYLDNDTNTSLYIDVLPLDGFPDSKEERHRIIIRKELIRKCLVWANTKIGTGKTALRMIFKIPIVLICKAIGANAFAKSWAKLAMRYKISECKDMAVIGGNYYKEKEYVPREEWFKLTEVEFEGKMFSCMGCWKRHLELLYGDYMRLPPVAERVSHHSFTAYMA